MVDSLSNVDFSPINLLNNTNQMRLDDRRLLTKTSKTNQQQQQNIQQKQNSTTNNLPKNSMNAAVVASLLNQQNSETTKLDLLSPFYSQWRDGLLNTSTINSLNNDNQFDGEQIRNQTSFRDHFSPFSSNLNSLNSLNNQNNQNNQLNNLTDPSLITNATNNATINAAFQSSTNYSIDLANDLDSAINCNKLLSQHPNSTTTNTTNSTLTTYNLLQSIYPFITGHPSFYNLINNSNSSNNSNNSNNGTSFNSCSSLNKNHFVNNSQVYSNSLNLINKFDQHKNELKTDLNTNTQKSFQSDTICHETSDSI